MIDVQRQNDLPTTVGDICQYIVIKRLALRTNGNKDYHSEVIIIQKLKNRKKYQTFEVKPGRKKYYT